MAIPLYSNSAVEYFNQAIKQCCHESPHSLYSLQPCFTMLPSHVIVVNSLTSSQNFDLLDEILALTCTDYVSVMPPPALNDQGVQNEASTGVDWGLLFATSCW